MFRFTTELPIIYSVFCLILGLVYSFILYRRNDNLHRFEIILLFFLRTVFVSLITFLLLNPLNSIIKSFEEKPLIILAQDASISCSLSDDFNNFNQLKDRLSQDFDIMSFNYSDDVEEGLTKNKDGGSTNISMLLDHIDVISSGRNIAGVILSSDGLYNKGMNPVFHKVPKLFPFYTIQVGDTSVIKDVLISDVLYNNISLSGNISPIEVQIQADKCKEEDLKVSLYKDQSLIESKTLKVKKDSDFLKFKFFIEHQQIGINQYTVLVDPIEGERDHENNSFDLYIDVLDNQHKILILSDILHPDIGSFRSVFDHNKNYQVEFAKLESNDYDFDDYDLIVPFYISDYQDQFFNELKESKSSFLLFVNSKSSAILEELYPPGRASDYTTKKAFALYNDGFAKFNISKGLQDYFLELPPLNSILADYVPSISSEVLLFQKTSSNFINRPLIILDNFDNKKTAIVYGEGIWRWRIYDRLYGNYHENFEELFSKIVSYLVIQEEKNRFRVSFDKNISESEDVVFKCNYYNESYELDNNKEVTHTIINESGEEFHFVYSKYNESYYLNIGSLDPGRYSFRSEYNDEKSVEGEFIIHKEVVESVIDVADQQLLSQIAYYSGGKSFIGFNIQELINVIKLSDSNKTIIHTSEKMESLINNKWILIFLLMIISIEWIYRKYNGFY